VLKLALAVGVGFAAGWFLYNTEKGRSVAGALWPLLPPSTPPQLRVMKGGCNCP
jgi:hypothetical protein